MASENAIVEGALPNFGARTQVIGDAKLSTMQFAP